MKIINRGTDLQEGAKHVMLSLATIEGHIFNKLLDFFARVP